MPDSSIAFTAPHWAATEAGLEILREGGTAVEAMVTAAAVVSVVYPHMNAISGDGFWLIDSLDGNDPVAIDACGRSANNIERYYQLDSMPERGGQSALTQAGTVRGWQLALQQDKNAKLPLSRLLEPAIDWASKGFDATESLHEAINKISKVSERNLAFDDLYLNIKSKTFKNQALADTFGYLSKNGLDSFYQGDIAKACAETLKDEGSPLTFDDITNTRAEYVSPLSVNLQQGTIYNLPAPTQGVHSLQILSLVDRLRSNLSTDSDWLHLIVEATKQSFNQRDNIWSDIQSVSPDYNLALSDSHLENLSRNIDLSQAQPWPFSADTGDTVWMGARDKRGQMVSFIQSIYWEFGSGVLIPDCGFVWNNRGVSFSLDKNHINYLSANKKPAHTLNPAMAKLDDGRRIVYGTMGGEGQPQTQAVILSNYLWRDLSLKESIASPRWVLGRTWGDSSSILRVEKKLADKISKYLDDKGHEWLAVSDDNEIMGHAGAIVDNSLFNHSDSIKTNKCEAATDPRSDGLSVAENI